MQLVAMTRLRYPTWCSVLERFAAGGWAAIFPAQRGRSRGHGRVLSMVQEHAIQRLIIDKRPGATQDEFQLVAPGCGGATHRERVQPTVSAQYWQVTGALGAHSAEADQKSQRTTRGGSAAVAGASVSRH
jgi:hypothetical protein